MAKRMNAKLILELRSCGSSRKSIAQTRRMSMHTVMAVFDAADAQKISWHDIRDKGNEEVCALLFPDKATAERLISRPDYVYVHDELKKTGVTLKLLWEEYCSASRESGSTHVSYTTYTRGYADFVVAKNVTNHLDHKPGQVMEVDWSGATMRLVNPATAEISKVYLFVAVLPYSQYTYVEAALDMRQNTWLTCHVNAYEFFGGVALKCVCDNLKTGVIAHPREGEIVLNEAYEALARHYMCAIMPTGVAKPKQKASVEGAVGKIATAVIARLRNENFTSLADLNAAIRTCLADYNAAPFQKRDGSRREVFELVEKECLAPLPATAYEICTWVYGRSVNLDFHVVHKTNRYSVPHTLVGRKVDLKVGDKTVEVFDCGTRVATHMLFPDFVSYKHATSPEHMPSEFCRPDWDDGRMRRWAKEIGPGTLCVVERIFDDVQIKEQGYNAVLAILNLSTRYGKERLERACAYALEKTARPRHRFLKTVLASGVADQAEPPVAAEESGGYVRGGGYYSSTKTGA